MEDKGSLCFLKNYESFEIALKELGLSKSQIKKYLSKKLRDQKIEKQKEYSLSLNLLNPFLVNPIFSKESIPILFEDDFFLALDKPTELHNHPLSYSENDNALSFLRSIGKMRHIYKDQWDQGLMYRLDYETSGVLIFIKDLWTHQKIRNNFQGFIKHKKYRCWVEGDFNEVGERVHQLIRSQNKGHLVKEDLNGESVKAEFSKISYDEKRDQSLLEVRLLTGFQHQIRVQCMLLGHPIIGDPLYKGRKSDRLYLHAWEYAFDWRDESYLIKAPNPLFIG